MNFIITSGPQHNRSYCRGSNVRSRSSKRSPHPRCAVQPARDRSTVVLIEQVVAGPNRRIRAYTKSCRANGHHTANSVGRTAADRAATRRSPAAAEPARCPPRPDITSRPTHWHPSASLLPNGPRSPSVSPDLQFASVRVTLPATRIVWAHVSRGVGIFAQRNRNFARTGQIQHVELTRCKSIGPAAARREMPNDRLRHLSTSSLICS